MYMLHMTCTCGQELDKYDKKVSAVVQKLLKECGDVVTYKVTH